MPTRPARLAVFGLALGATALGVTAPPVAAHVTADRSEVPAGAFTAVALTVPHGCDGSATTAIAVQVPAGINDVTPQVVPGWDVEVTTESLPEPIEGGHGEQITERDSVVTFTAEPGNELPDGFRQSFTLGFQAPDTPGEHLFFKTIQTCTAGETAWIEEFTGEGEEPEHPAPAVLVVEDAASDHAAGDDAAADDAASDDTAVDDGDDNGSSTGLAVAGLVVGAAGLLTGGAALARSRKTAGS